jgi:Anti-sigma-D factor RsdA to sigma factor binding region
MIGRRSSRRTGDGRAGGTGGPGTGNGGLGNGSGMGGGELSADELAALRTDDLLLDALGRGEPATGDDELAALLGAWRAEMDTEPLPTIDVSAIAPAADLYAEPFADPVSAGTGVAGAGGATGPSGGVTGAGTTDRVRVRPATTGRATARPPGGAPAGAAPAGTGPGDTRAGRGRTGGDRRLPRGLRLGLAVLLLIAAAGGLSVAANVAGPDGPLWSVVRLVDPAGADLREAQDAVAKAEKAAAEQRYADAWQLVDKADPLVARVRDPQRQAELRDRLDALRHSLPVGASGDAPGAVPGGVPSVPGGLVPTGTPGQATPGPGGATGGGTGGSTPGTTAPGLLPGLPPLLPSPSSSPAPPLPTCILPSIPLLPGLPPPLCH